MQPTGDSRRALAAKLSVIFRTFGAGYLMTEALFRASVRFQTILNQKQGMKMIRIIAMLSLLGLSVGCGGSSHGPLGQVKGTITLEGQPISEGTIVFEVTNARPATGSIQAGRIVDVTCYEPNDGVPVGTAAVAIFATGSTPAPMVEATPANPGDNTKLDKDYMGGGAKSLIPKRYNDPATSELTCEIVSGMNQVTFDLKKQ